jgi:predicted dehydrogenase
MSFTLRGGNHEAGEHPGPNKLLRAAVIGVGFVGSAHVEAIRRTGLAEVVSVAAGTPQSAATAAEQLHVPHAAGSLEDLLSNETIDVIHNCTPNALHAQVASAALSSNKHLVTEKPLAVSTRESRMLCALAADAKVVSAVCHNYRHFAMVQEARRLVAKGAIGRVHLVHGSYLQDWLSSADVRNWRLDRAAAGPSLAFADIGTHWCDLVCHVLGDSVAAVTARTGSLHDRQGDDHVGALLELRRGAFAVVTASQVSPGRKNRLWFQIDGEEGSVAWDQERPDELWIGRSGKPNEEVRKDPAFLHETVTSLAHFPSGHVEGWNTSFKNLFLSVYRTILGAARAEDARFATIPEAHEHMMLIEAVLESSETGSRVELAPAAESVEQR